MFNNSDAMDKLLIRIARAFGFFKIERQSHQRNVFQNYTDATLDLECLKLNFKYWFRLEQHKEKFCFYNGLVCLKIISSLQQQTSIVSTSTRKTSLKRYSSKRYCLYESDFKQSWFFRVKMETNDDNIIENTNFIRK